MVIACGFFIIKQISPFSTTTQKPHLENSHPNQTTTINAKDYQQFWLWTPPKHPEKLAQASTLYLLQGEIDLAPQRATLSPKGLSVRPLPNKKIWLVYRITTPKSGQITAQQWTNEVMPTVFPKILTRLNEWQKGNDVQGIQIDFDSPTYQLDNYDSMLKSIRQQLPIQYKLSVTGLLDWANQAQNPAFLAMCESVDELVMQTYQGTTTLSQYQSYLKKLANMPINFKIGLVENGQWQGLGEAKAVENNPHFQGYVVFLQDVR